MRRPSAPPTPSLRRRQGPRETPSEEPGEARAGSRRRRNAVASSIIARNMLTAERADCGHPRKAPARYPARLAAPSMRRSKGRTNGRRRWRATAACRRTARGRCPSSPRRRQQAIARPKWDPIAGKTSARVMLDPCSSDHGIRHPSFVRKWGRGDSTVASRGIDVGSALDDGVGLRALTAKGTGRRGWLKDI